MLILAYREYSQHVEARTVTAYYDVQDLADPSDLGDADERTLIRPSTPDELQKNISGEIVRIYGEGAEQSMAPDAHDQNPTAASTTTRTSEIESLRRLHGGLQRVVSRSASGLLRTAPPPQATNPQVPPREDSIA
jgi:hypothetical protein